MTGTLFTLDLEDHTGAHAPDGRYVSNTLKILDLCQENGIRGTIFVVGRVARAAPELVREAARRGHEIACHSLAHMPLDADGPAAFRHGTAEAKALLEDVTGQAVRGYRAPRFSLTRQSLWAPDILTELGFTYSSSVMPAHNPISGLPGAPQAPFRWSGGLVEFPCPVCRIGPLALPYLGGIYMRYLPLAVIRACAAGSAAGVRWIYCHPYDIDHDEPYGPIAGAGRLTSLLLWLNRRPTEKRIVRLATPGAPTLGELAQTLKGLETWQPKQH